MLPNESFFTPFKGCILVKHFSIGMKRHVFGSSQIFYDPYHFRIKIANPGDDDFFIFLLDNSNWFFTLVMIAPSSPFF